MDKVVLIMAGGSGTRFWPLSTSSKPKQFLDLVSDKTMIQETIDRISKKVPTENIYISTNIMYLDLIKEQLPNILEKNIIFEPLARDTAACIGYAAILINKMHSDSVMAVLPSDHLIEKEEVFLSYIDKAFEEAYKRDCIVTLGIEPTYPETGYGYIEYMKSKSNDLSDSDRDIYKNIYSVKSFREKPNVETAEKYIEKGNFLWNSGMFIWKTSLIISEIMSHMESHKLILDNIKEKISQKNLDAFYGKELSDYVKEDFEKFEKISIDFGVMEKTKKVFVIPVNIGWNDVGSFKSLEDVFEKDVNDNIIKSMKYFEIDSESNIIINKEPKKIIATIGLEDYVVVNTEDALLICDKNKAQEIKKILDKIEKLNKK